MADQSTIEAGPPNIYSQKIPGTQEKSTTPPPKESEKVQPSSITLDPETYLKERGLYRQDKINTKARLPGQFEAINHDFVGIKTRIIKSGEFNLIKEDIDRIRGILEKMKIFDPEMHEALQNSGLEIAIIPNNLLERARADVNEKNQTPILLLNESYIKTEETIAHEAAHAGFGAAHGSPHSRILQEMVAIRLGSDYVNPADKPKEGLTLIIDGNSSLAPITPNKSATDTRTMLNHPLGNKDIRLIHKWCLNQNRPFPTNYLEFTQTAEELDADSETISEILQKEDEYSYYYAAAYALAIENKYGRKGVKEVAKAAAQQKLIKAAEEKTMAALDPQSRELYQAEKLSASNTSRFLDIVAESNAKEENFLLLMAIEQGLNITAKEAQSLMEKAAKITLQRADLFIEL